MKNKYLNKFFCITMLSAMVLAIPTGVKAAEEADNVVAEEGVSGCLLYTSDAADEL